MLEEFPESEETVEEQASRGIKIGIIGRPNVGKSTLVNEVLLKVRGVTVNGQLLKTAQVMQQTMVCYRDCFL